VFLARYELNSYIVFRKHLVFKRLIIPTAVDTSLCFMSPGFKQTRAFIWITMRLAILIIPQNHWVSRLCPSSGILNSRKHKV
jgi:hypothetical protein